jgi:hypothetical protein
MKNILIVLLKLVKGVTLLDPSNMGLTTMPDSYQTQMPGSGSHARSRRRGSSNHVRSMLFFFLKIYEFTYNCSKNIFILYFHLFHFNKIYSYLL